MSLNIKHDQTRVLLKFLFSVALILGVAFLVLVNIKKFDDRGDADVARDLADMREEVNEQEDAVAIKTIPALLEYFEQNNMSPILTEDRNSTYAIIDGISFIINGDPFTVYEFRSSEEAKEASFAIIKDFTSSEEKGDTHFFRKGAIVVEYLGTNSDTLLALEEAFGPQFAGE